MYKRPESVLVVIYCWQQATDDLQILLLNRQNRPGYWQSVTGSLEEGELASAAAIREIFEETALATNSNLLPNNFSLTDWQISQSYEIFLQWRHRYPPQTTHNLEHFFSLQLPDKLAIKLSNEHSEYQWLPWYHAAALCFSWSNRNAILHLRRHLFS